MLQDVPILGGGACGEDGLFELNGQILGFARRPPMLVGVKDVYALYVYGDSMVPWREPRDRWSTSTRTSQSKSGTML
jgi:phage repressor protein C with HTH and peptisase S24 domain